MTISNGILRMLLQNLVKDDIIKVDPDDAGFLKLDKKKVGKNVRDSDSEIFKVAGVFPPSIRLIAVTQDSGNGNWVTAKKAQPFSISTNCKARVECLTASVERTSTDEGDKAAPATEDIKKFWDIELLSFNDYDTAIRYLIGNNVHVTERDKLNMHITAYTTEEVINAVEKLTYEVEVLTMPRS